MSDWKPIESAPKDGSHIIAARFSRGHLDWVSHAHWASAEDSAEAEGGSPDDYISCWSREGDEICPTHWQELSQPAGE